MQPAYSLQLAVEVPTCGMRVIRAAGELDRASASRLAELIAEQARRVAAELGGDPDLGHIVIDLGNVRFFGRGGLEVLLDARDGGRPGVALHLAGLGPRELLLPQRVIDLLAGFSTFATLEQALRGLLGPDDELDAH